MRFRKSQVWSVARSLRKELKEAQDQLVTAVSALESIKDEHCKYGSSLEAMLALEEIEGEEEKENVS